MQSMDIADEIWWIDRPRPIKEGGFFDAWAVTLTSLTDPSVGDYARCVARDYHLQACTDDDWVSIAALTLFGMARAIGPMDLAYLGSARWGGVEVRRPPAGSGVGCWAPDGTAVVGRADYLLALGYDSKVAMPSSLESIPTVMRAATPALIAAATASVQHALWMLSCGFPDPQERWWAVSEALTVITWLGVMEWSPVLTPGLPEDVLRLAIRCLQHNECSDWDEVMRVGVAALRHDTGGA